MNEEELKLLKKIEELPKELNIEIRGLILAEVCLRIENQQLKQQLQQRDNIINYCKFQIEKENDKFPFPLESQEWLKGRISAFEEILYIDKGE